MSERICSTTSAVLEAINDGDTPEISGPINLTIPLTCDIHCVGGQQTFVVRGTPTITIDGDASTVVNVLGTGSPTIHIGGTSSATVTIDVDDGATPTVVIDDSATPSVSLTRGAAHLAIQGASQPRVSLRGGQAFCVNVLGAAQPQLSIETSPGAAWSIVFDEQSAGNVAVIAADVAATLTIQGAAQPQVNLRQATCLAVTLAGTSHAAVYSWDDCAAVITAVDNNASTLSTYNRSNLTVVGNASSPLAVDAHHNSQLLVSGSVTVAPDSSVAVQISGDGPIVNGTCMKQIISPLVPPILVPPAGGP